MATTKKKVIKTEPLAASRRVVGAVIGAVSGPKAEYKYLAKKADYVTADGKFSKVKKSNVSSGKGFDLVKDKMRAQVSKVKKQVRSSTVSRGCGKAGGGNNFCKSKSKF